MTPYFVYDFTGPGARYSLLGDRVTKHPVLPVEPDGLSPSVRKRNAASSQRHKDRQRTARVLAELTQWRTR